MNTANSAGDPTKQSAECHVQTTGECSTLVIGYDGLGGTQRKCTVCGEIRWTPYPGAVQ
jgi:hypothetical protein